jgi:hypothetical protein
MPIFKDTETGETFRVHVCYQCDIDRYPTGKPIDATDKLAEPLPDGSGWVCGDCKVEELNKRKLRVLGPQHPDVQAFITREEREVRRWNQYARRVNKTMNAGLPYKTNRYTGRTPF